MSRIAIIKIHPGLNMAVPQLSGDLIRAGHKTRMFFFKTYKSKCYRHSPARVHKQKQAVFVHPNLVRVFNDYLITFKY